MSPEGSWASTSGFGANPRWHNPEDDHKDTRRLEDYCKPINYARIAPITNYCNINVFFFRTVSDFLITTPPEPNISSWDESWPSHIYPNTYSGVRAGLGVAREPTPREKCRAVLAWQRRKHGIRIRVRIGHVREKRGIKERRGETGIVDRVRNWGIRFKGSSNPLEFLSNMEQWATGCGIQKDQLD